MNEFPSRLRELRLERNLSQAELAKFIGVNKSAISFWELGENEPKIQYLLILGNFFKVSIFDLLGIENEGNKLSEEEFKLLAIFRNASEEDQKLIFSLAERFGKTKK